MSAQPAAAAGRGGRPKSTEKRAAIVQAASTLFLEQGLQGTSMERVARAAGVSKQTLYSHFAGKEDLFQHCIRAKVESYGFDGATVPPGEDARAVLRTLVQRFMDLILDPEVVATHRLVIAEACAHPGIAARFFDSGPAAIQHTVATALEELVRRGLLRRHDTRAAAWQLLNLCFGSFQLRLLLNLIDGVPEAELAAHLASAVDDFVRLHGAQPPADAVSSRS
ncbi:TetR/AcrR family transcriptional regulator [uncultured Thiohalocapsa sp.]|uniref:TetR/AcrR family transcriptional regulator n=1 Tax=uncultured Thiohalocapsa sp. TaxID=768990 RepID=UPI0025DE4EE1|nr:TetR/AcrR family transcriptional regulator [uncultured Thiohalocapsa sp.]